MACLGGEAQKRHEYFLKKINKKNNEVKNIHRIILIGTGESGKSTFVKQMKLLSSINQTFPDAYRAKFIPEIQRNLVQALTAILQFMDQIKMEFKHANSELMRAKKEMYDIRDQIDKNPDMIERYTNSTDTIVRTRFYENCKALWSDQSMMDAYQRSNEFQLIDSAQYFLDRIDLISDLNYKPSDDDVLQCRTKTLGIHTEIINYNNVNFELVDVGGQRDQRAKWIEALSDGVTAVIFLTDVSAYDMVLAEDQTTNRLRESVSLLGQVWTKNPLRDKSIILFLNKQDKLEMKVRKGRTHIETYFPEFKSQKCKHIFELIKELKSAMGKRSKKESDIWEKYFSYFLPQIRDQKKSDFVEDPARQHREAQIINEYSQIQSQVAKVFNDGSVDKWLPDGEDGEIFDKLMKNEDFAIFHKRLMNITFYQVVSITFFIENQFLHQCEQTNNRHIYPYPTTAIDKRNVDRVFESCKDILQGKLLTEIMA